MTPDKVASTYSAHRVGDGQWRAKCPAHDGKSADSMSIRSTGDGKTLIRCWAGCPTENILTSVGLTWAALFPPELSLSSSHRAVDPKIVLRREAENALRKWKEKQGSIMSARIWLRHRLVTEGERLIAEGRKERGWSLLQLGYEGLSRLDWLADLLDSRQPQDWLTARRFLKGSSS